MDPASLQKFKILFKALSVEDFSFTFLSNIDRTRSSWGERLIRISAEITDVKRVVVVVVVD